MTASILLISGCTSMKYSGTGDTTDSCGGTPDNAEYGLALSGGGYRAMLYHVGSLWRLHELGLLKKMDIISSVSGGSITAAQLALNWDKLMDGGDFRKLIAEPLLGLNNKSIDVSAVLVGMLPGTNASSRVASLYDKHLYKKKSLQNIPDPADGAPIFSILSTNLRTGKLAKFRHNCFYHYPTGYVPYPDISVGVAVASSSAFPPFLSPNTVEFEPGSVKRIQSGRDIGDLDLYDNTSYRYEYKLSDGGVYDNLGLEDINSDKLSHIFVSDAGAAYQPRDRIFSNWIIQMVHVLGTIDSQVRIFRIDELSRLIQEKSGAYWRIHTTQDIYTSGRESFDLKEEFEANEVGRLSGIPTRLSTVDTPHQLINWGYTSTDNSLNRFYSDIDAYSGEFKLPY